MFDTTIYKQTQDVEKQTKNTTQYVSDTTLYKQTQDEEKQTKNTTQYVSAFVLSLNNKERV